MAGPKSKTMIFIAHDGADAAVAVALKDWIERLFLNCDAFVSGPDLEGGHTWPETLRQHLERAKVIIALITPSSVGSRWVHFEAGAGFVDKKTIPLCVGIPIDDIGAPLKLIQGRNADSGGLKQLAADIARLIGARAPDDLPNVATTVTKLVELLPAGAGDSKEVDYDPELLEMRRDLVNEATAYFIDRLAKKSDPTLPALDDLHSLRIDELVQLAFAHDVSISGELDRGLTRPQIPEKNAPSWKKSKSRAGLLKAKEALAAVMVKADED